MLLHWMRILSENVALQLIRELSPYTKLYLLRIWHIRGHLRRSVGQTYYALRHLLYIKFQVSLTSQDGGPK